MSNSETLENGYKCLVENLGVVEAEKFISLVIREQDDYTKWRQKYFADSSVDDIVDSAVEFAKTKPYNPVNSETA
ncbi:MAG: hypothetical protein J6Z43_02160 [Clostridiales bacterium]|nr:hypothetical protein [Clostridiales bacterium]